MRSKKSEKFFSWQIRVGSEQGWLLDQLHFTENTLGISLTDAKIIESMHRNEIPADLVQLLHDLDQLRKSSE